jgi:secreted trypsin-like serine protease
MKLYAQAFSTVAFVLFAVGCTPASKSNTIDATKASSIIGGTNVPEGAILQKSVVAIFDMKKGALCTGSLLENNIVLTAAHCIGDNAQDHLIVFSSDLLPIFEGTDKSFLLQRVRRATKTLVNPNWGKTNMDPEASWGDTALIKFEGSTPAGFTPATILASADGLPDGTTITVAGYGVSSDVLTEIKKEEVPDFKEKELKGEVFCERLKDGKTEKCYKEDMSGEGRLRTTELKVVGDLNESEIIFDQQQGQASCEGDSGGPAYLKQANGEYHLFGVTSRGTRGCNGYVVYSDISSIKLNIWLKDAMAQLK